MSNLFSPLQIKKLILKNRIVVSPMCQYSATEGFANDWHLVHIGSRAVGGAGLVIMEAAAVSPEGRISYGDLGIWNDEHISFLKRITDFVRAQGSASGIQLAHAGRKASTELSWKGGKQIKEGPGSWQTIGPSSIPFYEGDIAPREASIADIEHIKADFKNAAARALQAGFDVIEIHAAHGYLLHQFLSPISNQRNDQYGGSFENRIRLLKEVVTEVKQVWPSELPLFVRISATDWVEGGWNPEESTQLAVLLKTWGVDLIDCSSGGLAAHQQIPVFPGYQVQFSDQIRKTGILTGAVGLITSAEQAETILQEDQADLIFMAREFLRDPYFPLHAAHDLGDDLQWPDQYDRAKPRKR